MASHLKRQVGVDQARLDTKTGILFLRAKPGQRVELSKVLESVKPFGFSPVTEMDLSAPGRIAARRGRPVFEIDGTGEVFAVSSKNLLKGLDKERSPEQLRTFRIKLVPKGQDWIITSIQADSQDSQPQP